MCGRCASSRDPEGVRHACAYRPSGSKQAVKPSWAECSPQHYYPSYNISPQSNMPVIVSGHHAHLISHCGDLHTQASLQSCDENKERVLQTMKWGLIPSWHRGSLGSFGTVLNNCRQETMLEKPSFRSSVQRGQRCVAIADGFFEWFRGRGKKQPYFIYFRDNFPTEEMEEVSKKREGGDQQEEEKVEAEQSNVWTHPTGRMLTMAGLFDVWKEEHDAHSLYTFTVITVAAHPTFAHIHDRMPAILDGQETVQAWLDPAKTTREVTELLQPSNSLHWHPVSSVVNNSRNHSPECVLPIDPSKQVSSKQNTLFNWFSKSSEQSAVSKECPSLGKRPKLDPAA